MSTPKPPGNAEPVPEWNQPTIDVAASRRSAVPVSAGESPVLRSPPQESRVPVPAPANPGDTLVSAVAPPDAADGKPLPGTVIAGRFQLDEPIGSGGMGTVYKASHLTLRVPIAIKLLHRHIAARPEAMRRFRREAQVTSRIQHNNIVRVLDFGEDAGLAYIAMEFIQGVSLADWLQSRGAPPPLAEASEIFLAILSAFEAAHALGVVHRDLKPENVMLATDSASNRVVKVVDFGLAHVDFDPEGLTPLTQSDQVAGTPWYMSPEQCRSLVVGPLSDIYSLGCVLTALLQLEPPFQSGAAAEIMSQHMYLPVPPLKRPPEAEPVPVLLELLRLDLLAKDPERRPQSAGAVRERFLAAVDPRANESQFPGRKADLAPGDRAARAVGWQREPEPHRSPAADGTIRVGLFKESPARDGGVDSDCILGLATQGVHVASWHGASGKVSDDVSILVIDGAAELDSTCDRVREVRKSDTRRAIIVCIDGLTTESINRLIEAGATDVSRYPIRAADLSRKIGRAVRKLGR